MGEGARQFLKLGTIAFGGPAAHIAMRDDEMVRKRGRLTQDRFLDGVNGASLGLMATVTRQLAAPA